MPSPQRELFTPSHELAARVTYYNVGVTPPRWEKGGTSRAGLSGEDAATMCGGPAISPGCLLMQENGECVTHAH